MRNPFRYFNSSLEGKRDTPEYGQCRMTLDARHEANKYDLGKALRGAGAGLQSIN
jgi:hypothetical protein